MTNKLGAIMNEINPLKQYFRRPGLYLKLPSGGSGYTPADLVLPENGELPVYPMTAIDEITAKTPDALYNGVAITEIIKSCVPNILDPWKITSVDLDAVLIAIRAATSGGEMELETNCPECKEDGKYGLNLIGLLSNIKAGDYDSKLIFDDLTIKLRPLTFKESNQGNTIQFELQRMLISIQNIEDEDARLKASTDALAKVNNITMNLISDSIEYIKTPNSTVLDKEFILEYLQNCDKNTFAKIRQATIDLREDSEIKPLSVKCVHCEYEYTQPFTLNISNFFD